METAGEDSREQAAAEDKRNSLNLYKLLCPCFVIPALVALPEAVNLSGIFSEGLQEGFPTCPAGRQARFTCGNIHEPGLTKRDENGTFLIPLYDRH
jgi:hypothetical protein